MFEIDTQTLVEIEEWLIERLSYKDFRKRFQIEDILLGIDVTKDDPCYQAIYDHVASKLDDWLWHKNESGYVRREVFMRHKRSSVFSDGSTINIKTSWPPVCRTHYPEISRLLRNRTKRTYPRKPQNSDITDKHTLKSIAEIEQEILKYDNGPPPKHLVKALKLAQIDEADALRRERLAEEDKDRAQQLLELKSILRPHLLVGVS